ncbi:MAG: DUF3866 family protein [Actinomycetota bacterium]
MPTFRTGTVVAVDRTHTDGVQELTVDVDGAQRKAFLFPRWAAPASEGHRVVLNTTAVDLELGTGGSDFVVWNTSVDSYDAPSGGHIMKLRYTPAQSDVLAVEAQESPHHDVMRDARSLNGCVVVATSLHSQLLPVLCGIRSISIDKRVAYVMTDGAAVEAGFSNTIRRLRERAWIEGVVTTGHAVGGDLEAVTLHSGLLAAKHVLDADIVIAGIGPGVVGTGTPYGTTAVDLGTIALAGQALGGRVVVCLRLSEGDPRPRHHGVSHHMAAALGWVASAMDPDASCVVAPRGWRTQVTEAVPGWRVEEHAMDDIQGSLAAASELGLGVSHMGRSVDDDALFFEAAGAAGAYAAMMLR